MMTKIISLFLSILTALFSSLFVPIESPDYETVNINGIDYRNYFAGQDMHLVREYSFGGDEPVYVETISTANYTETIKYFAMETDWIHKGGYYDTFDEGRLVFCPLEQWETLNSYYSDGNNYRYYCEIYSLRSESDPIIQEFSNVDFQAYNKVISVLDGIGSVNFFMNYKALPIDDYPVFLLFRESKDGIFYAMSEMILVYEGQYYNFGAINYGLEKVEVSALPQEQQETLSLLFNQS